MSCFADCCTLTCPPLGLPVDAATNLSQLGAISPFDLEVYPCPPPFAVQHTSHNADMMENKASRTPDPSTSSTTSTSSTSSANATLRDVAAGAAGVILVIDGTPLSEMAHCAASAQLPVRASSVV